MRTAEIYSCDDHLDMAAVPTDVWSSRLSSEDAARGPHVEEQDGQLMWVCEDRVLGAEGRRKGGNSEALKKLSAIGRAGHRGRRLPRRQREAAARGPRPRRAGGVGHLRAARDRPDDQRPRAPVGLLRGLERLGRGGFQPGRAGSALVLALPPRPLAPTAAAAELERCAALGPRGAIIDVFEMDLADRKWDRLWDAGEETGLPISLHIKAGSWSGLSYQIGKWQAAAFATIMPLQLDEILATLIFSGVLERHPRCSSCSRSRASAGCRSSLPGPTWSGTRSRTSSTTRPSSRRASCSVATCTPRSRRSGSRADRGAGRGSVHVGVGLPAHRQHVPELARGDRGDPRRADARGPSEGHRDELRGALQVPVERLIRGA